MQKMDFSSIKYLKNGNDRQKMAYRCLTDLRLFEILEQFNPILAGTIPINIDIENSDLDIICECVDVDLFYNFLIDNFGNQTSFSIAKLVVRNVASIVANFESNEFSIEIFGQNCPTKFQYAYLHMLAEHNALQQGGEKMRHEIIKLKLQGYKTEPAFAKVLCLNGDPYEAVLKLYTNQ